jgi:hypothetical protein
MAGSSDWDDVTSSSYKSQAGDVAVYANEDGGIGHIMVAGPDGQWYNASLGDHGPKQTTKDPSKDPSYKMYRFNPKKPGPGRPEGSPAYIHGRGGWGHPQGRVRI